MRDFVAFVRRHLPSARLPAERYDAIVDELASELEARYAKRVHEGATDEEAWNAVVAEIPSWVDLAHELSTVTAPNHAERARRPVLTRVAATLSPERWMRDFRLAWRILARDRGFALTAIVTLAICFGGHAAIVAAVNTVLLHPLRAPEPDRILLMASQYPRLEARRTGTVSAPPDFADRREYVTTLDDQAMYNFSDATIEDDGIPTRVRGIVATPALFALLRASAAHGRFFTESDVAGGHPQVIVLTDRLWRDLYGGDPAVVGRSMRLSGRDFVIVGVLSPGFSFGGPDVRFYSPLVFTDRQRSDDARHSNGWYSIGRLKPNATIEQVRAQLQSLDAINLNRAPSQMRPLLENAGFFTSVERLQDVMIRDVRGPLTLLWGAALVVLAIGVANIGSLAIARSRVRRNELGTRLALGAHRFDLVRQLMVEGVVVAWVAMCAGLVLGAWLLASFRTSLFAGREMPQLDLVVIATTAVIATLAGILIGGIAAVPLLSHTPGALMQNGGRTGGRGRASRATRRGLVVAQVASAFVLLVGAGLLSISLRNLLAVDTGFKADGVITAGMSLPGHRYTTPDDAREFVNRSLATIRALPGVAAAGATTIVPLGGNYQSGIILAEGHVPGPGESAVSGIRMAVTPGYFEAVGTTLVAGRYFDEGDNHRESTAIIVDEGLARRFWRDRDPIGQRMFRPDSPQQITTIDQNTRWLTVVGVVGVIKLRGPASEEVTTGAFYLPYAVTAPRDFGYVIKSHVDPTAIVGELRTAFASLDRDAPLFDVRTLDERTTLSLTSRASTMRIATLFAAVALLLSAVGLYGTLAYLVTQRTREFGIRLAVGSTPRLILGLVLREGLLLALAGVLLGGLGSLAIRRVLTPQLYGVGASDVRVLILITLGLATISLLASALPARRATKIDVVQTLSSQ